MVDEYPISNFVGQLNEGALKCVLIQLLCNPGSKEKLMKVISEFNDFGEFKGGVNLL